MRIRPLGRRLAQPMAALFLLALVGGCGGSRSPVGGRVLLNGQPLQGKEGAVVFKPDAAKGNAGKESAMGVLQRDGTYSVQTNGKPGASLGWYKVIVTATEPAANPNDDARPAVHARYVTEANTPLAFEVVANPAPGRYDLELTR